MIISQALLSGATLAFLYVILRGRTSAPFWQSLGWRDFHKMATHASIALRYIFGGFGLAVLVGWAGNFVGRESGIPMEELFRSRQSVLMLMALGILVAPVVEETIFRGCIYPVIARKFGITAGVVSTGALFGLAHAQQLGGAWGQIGLLICVGIVLTYVRARAGTSPPATSSIWATTRFCSRAFSSPPADSAISPPVEPAIRHRRSGATPSGVICPRDP